ncbi:TPA: RNA-binding S4 domain-containing protein [Corynebacterium striatum]|uniref:RNA-binding S4 domain-containing protein n=1 Tax=Corynebacterium striatum TaxID=43770 RepID=A0AAQ1TWV8_CORST|nr:MULTISPECIES: RNA-binding S4 domain-containing protein [Corynebacterium]ATZ05028.1 RNA-binding S4 domain-containing protein [Corynebacterium striatum]ATZ08194.1 RNA-binding S4 domain-containing protein [Corynebacterium striatum]EEI78780.1 S4 domain protein [Corynebacterium striatum ATCC 6940]EGT5574135.1 RNA-binding S4 domain-containing protein [Corynebacterium striatum]EGT5591596.1 RNA-binding S4 domain-containing protein [Corynebacterium striatum]
MPLQPDSKPVRIDAWVWSVRMAKTRSEAADAVKAGHVKLNGNATKPSQQVVPGDRVRIWRNHHEHDLEVLATVSKRVGAPIARTCYVDHAPPPPPKEFMPSVPVRERGSGRPTKKERREMDKFRGGFR